MIYEYECSVHGVFDVIKSVKDLDREETCAACDFPMRRLISSPAAIGCDNFESGYYHAFGKEMHSKRAVKDELVRIKGETGQELHEIGNDSMKTVKRTRHEFPSTREVLEREKWQN